MEYCRRKFVGLYAASWYFVLVPGSDLFCPYANYLHLILISSWNISEPGTYQPTICE
jgi:hypothetical protein